MHGLKLGTVAFNLRQRKDRLSESHLDGLEALGFDWGIYCYENWENTLLALTTYEEIHGDLRVPQTFVIPTDDQVWPEATHGMKLGTVVAYLRQRKASLPQHQIDALDFFGFEWTVIDG
jgi:hypothetical protein